jgi:hypothetical protein
MNETGPSDVLMPYLFHLVFRKWCKRRLMHEFECEVEGELFGSTESID